jgi:hypothetical protein
MDKFHTENGHNCNCPNYPGWLIPHNKMDTIVIVQIILDGKIPHSKMDTTVMHKSRMGEAHK